jgi:hypothetical protein
MNEVVVTLPSAFAKPPNLLIPDINEAHLHKPAVLETPVLRPLSDAMCG